MKYLHYTKVAGLLFAISSTVLLSGCANMLNQMGYQRIARPNVKACEQASTLITNLEAKPKDRQYMLLDGTRCFQKVRRYDRF